MKQTTSEVAAVSPAKQAAPKPRCGSSITSAPSRAAISSDPSLDPLSTTMGRYPDGRALSTTGMAAASSSTGRMTSMVLAVGKASGEANAVKMVRG